jgi:hypothetical protein
MTLSTSILVSILNLIRRVGDRAIRTSTSDDGLDAGRSSRRSLRGDHREAFRAREVKAPLNVQRIGQVDKKPRGVVRGKVSDLSLSNLTVARVNKHFRP